MKLKKKKKKKIMKWKVLPSKSLMLGQHTYTQGVTFGQKSLENTHTHTLFIPASKQCSLWLSVFESSTSVLSIWCLSQCFFGCHCCKRGENYQVCQANRMKQCDRELTDCFLVSSTDIALILTSTYLHIYIYIMYVLRAKGHDNSI